MAAPPNTVEKLSPARRDEIRQKLQNELKTITRPISKKLAEDTTSIKWSVIKKHENDTVEQGYVAKGEPGVDTPVFRSRGILPVTPKVAINRLLCSNEIRPCWNPSWRETKIFDEWEFEGEAFCIYWDSQNAALGGMIGARDFFQVRWITYDEDGTGWIYFQTFPDLSAELCSSVSHYVRATAYPCAYKCKPVDGGCEITFANHLSLGGRLPQYIINKGIGNELLAFYTKLRKHLEEEAAGKK